MSDGFEPGIDFPTGVPFGSSHPEDQALGQFQLNQIQQESEWASRDQWTDPIVASSGDGNWRRPATRSRARLDWSWLWCADIAEDAAPPGENGTLGSWARWAVWAPWSLMVSPFRNGRLRRWGLASVYAAALRTVVLVLLWFGYVAADAAITSDSTGPNPLLRGVVVQASVLIAALTVIAATTGARWRLVVIPPAAGLLAVPWTVATVLGGLPALYIVLLGPFVFPLLHALARWLWPGLLQTRPATPSSSGVTSGSSRTGTAPIRGVDRRRPLRKSEIERGSVWLATVAFSDGTGSKERPVVVLRIRDDGFEVAYTTSQDKYAGHPSYGYVASIGHDGRSSYVNFRDRRILPFDSFVHRLPDLTQGDWATIESRSRTGE